MSEYLADGTNFQDIPLKPKPEGGYPVGADTRCPLCKGHGGWNLTIDAYGKGKHFQAHCNQCNGWGWVREEDATCIHEYHEISQAECKKRGIYHAGRCWHVYQCANCPRVMAQDSSD